jgi:hypothetical protein
MTTRKDYNMTANVIYGQVAKAKEILDTISLSTLEQLARSFAKVYSDDNPRFDYSRFMTACGF